ncbi:MAG TPA: PAS domain-containing sensor histidine kinase [Candidatus Paceibacterota bacterium]
MKEKDLATERLILTYKEQLQEKEARMSIMRRFLEARVTERTAQLEKRNRDLGSTETAMLNILEDSRQLENDLQGERDKLQAVISSMGEGLYVVDAAFRVLIMNTAAEHMFDTKAQEVVGKDLRSLLTYVHGKDTVPDEERPSVQAIRDHRPVTIDLDDNIYFQTQSGKKIPVTLVATPITIGNAEAAIVVFRDISREKALDEAKSSFISIASHQLRTPLTSIRWYSEMLLDEDMGALSDGQKEFAKQIYEGALRLHETIDTLLSLSRLESGSMKNAATEIELKAFVGEAIKTLEPLYGEKKLSVSVDVPEGMRVSLDSFMLREVITNLVANSIRYTPEGGTIGLRCEDKGGGVQCSIADNGIGIPENQQEKIFQKFFRADNAMSKVPDGSGLGLALVKGFVEKWGGSVWFESHLGEGTTFHFTIPRGTLEEAHA